MNVSINQAPRNERERHILSWSEPSLEDANQENHWSVGPLILPISVWSNSTASTKRELFYTGEGLDIRNTAGTPLGDRKLTVTGNTKNCTLPISVIVIHTSLEDKEDQRFLEHWEDVTGLDIEACAITKCRSTCRVRLSGKR